MGSYGAELVLLYYEMGLFVCLSDMLRVSDVSLVTEIIERDFSNSYAVDDL